MAAALTLYRSSIGKKVVMAVSGIILFGFVFLHMFGNLKIFYGREHFNEYAAFLRTVGAPLFGTEQLLWLARIVLIVAVVLHIMSAYQLSTKNNASRPIRYQHPGRVQASYASRTMRWGGVIILLFIIYHLLHFTFGVVHPSFIPGDVYHNVVTGFQVWYVSIFYILAMLALCLHLYHGLWSMFQTLGLNNYRFTGFWRGFAVLFAIVVALGNITVPVAVMVGLVK